MQWDGSAQAGFTTGSHPWLAVNPNYKEINAAQEDGDAGSVLNYVRALLALRAKTKAFVYGDYEDLDPKDAHVFAYTRTLGAEKYLVVENFSSKPLSYTLPRGMKAGRLVLSDLPGSVEAGVSELKLGAWEARIYRE